MHDMNLLCRRGRGGWTMAKPIYEIAKYNTLGVALTRKQLVSVLEKLPLDIKIARGHALSLDANLLVREEEPILCVEHGAQSIVLRPKEGMRLYDGKFDAYANAFHPSRIMAEYSGGGACCSYQFNTADLRFPFAKELMLEIHKLG